MILLDYFTYGIFRFFCYIGKNEDDAKWLAVLWSGGFLGFATSIIYAIHLVQNEVSMSTNTMKYESAKVGLCTGLVATIICIIKYYWITPKKLKKIDGKYKQYPVLKRTIIRWLLIFVFTSIPVSLFIVYRYIEVKL